MEKVTDTQDVNIGYVLHTLLYSRFCVIYSIVFSSSALSVVLFLFAHQNIVSPLCTIAFKGANVCNNWLNLVNRCLRNLNNICRRIGLS